MNTAPKMDSDDISLVYCAIVDSVFELLASGKFRGRASSKFLNSELPFLSVVFSTLRVESNLKRMNLTLYCLH